MNPTQKRPFSLIIFTCLFVIASASNNYGNNPLVNISHAKADNLLKKIKPDHKHKRKDGPKEVKWLSMEEALKLCEKKPKKIFIDVYTDWCGWCKKMDKSTLKDPKITSYLNEDFYSVKLNAESDKKLVYKGKEMTEEYLATKIFKASGFPTTVYLDENQNLIQPISGYLEVDMLDKILHYYGKNHYKTMPWEKFQVSYNMDSN